MKKELIKQIRELSKKETAKELDYSKLSDSELKLIIDICRKNGKKQLIFEELSPEDKELVSDIFIKLQCHE